MMLVSTTWAPPSCLAMLPQKFSAATTTIFLPGPLLAAGVPEAAVEHPAAIAAAAAATAAATRYICEVTLIRAPDLTAARPAHHEGTRSRAEMRPLTVFGDFQVDSNENRFHCLSVERWPPNSARELGAAQTTDRVPVPVRSPPAGRRETRRPRTRHHMFAGRSVQVGFGQRFAGQAGGDDAGEVGARGDVFVLAAQRVGDGFSRGLGLGDLFVELGELAVGELPPAVDRVGARCEESLRFAKRARQDGLVNVGFEHGAVQAALKPHLTSDGVRLGSRAWLVTARSPGERRR